jgi:glycosyltransferase involved in cell wall biosynthesis
MTDASGHIAGKGLRRLVVVCNTLTPYRVHWHTRLAREIPELELHTLLYPCREKLAWTYDSFPPELRVKVFEPVRPKALDELVVLRANTPMAKLLSPRAIFVRLSAAWAEWKKAGEALRWLDEVQPAALLINGYGGICEARALLWSKKRRVPSFVWSDSNIYSDRAAGWRYRVKKLIVGHLLSCAAGILPCGRCGVQFYLRYYPHRDRMFFCPLEPDYAEIDRTTAAQTRSAAERFRLDPARKRFVAVSRLIPLKRVDTLIDAFARLADERPEWDLLIVGGGPEEESLARRIPAPLKHRVTVTGFLTDQAVVNACYKLSHVFVHPSENEAWAVVVNEAVAAGLPAIVTGVTGAAWELVKDGVNGRMFPPGDVGALTEAMLEASLPENTQKFSEGSREVMREWRAKADPIDGFRGALRFARVLPQDSPEPSP